MIDLNKLVQWGILLVLVVGGYIGWRQYERNIGARDVRIAQLEHRSDSLEHIVIPGDSIRFARRDTVKLFRTIATTDTVLRRLIDTALVHHTDTVTVTRTLLVTVDSTIRACRETVSECATLANDRGVLLVQKDSIIKILRQQRPSALSRCGLSVGYGIQASTDGRIRNGFAALAGCRVLP